MLRIDPTMKPTMVHYGTIIFLVSWGQVRTVKQVLQRCVRQSRRASFKKCLKKWTEMICRGRPLFPLRDSTPGQRRRNCQPSLVSPLFAMGRLK